MIECKINIRNNSPRNISPLSAVGSLIDLGAVTYQSRRTSYYKDIIETARDWYRVGDDLRLATMQYGKETSQAGRIARP